MFETRRINLTMAITGGVWLFALMARPLQADPAAFCTMSAAGQQLLNQYPAVEYHCEDAPGSTGGIKTFYGSPMTPALTPNDAVQAWIAQHAGAIDMTPQNLLDPRNPARQTSVGFGKFTAFVFQQMFYGFPVDGNTVRFLVLNGPTNRVVYVSAWIRDVVGNPPAPSPPAISDEDAVGILRVTSPFDSLADWSPGELVLVAGGETPVGSRLAWRLRGRRVDAATAEAFTVLIDASTGELVLVQNDVHEASPVYGVVNAFASPGALPDVPYNAPAAVILPGSRVAAFGEGVFAFADAGGNFQLDYGGNWPVSLEASLDGEFFAVIPDQGCLVTTSTPGITPSDSPVTLVLNEKPAGACIAEPNEFSTAQVNALLHATRARALFQDRQPGFDALGTSVVQVRVNRPGTPCTGDFVAPDTMLFSAAGGNCVNLAYSSVVAHEYGHLVIETLGLDQWAFGEGFSDSLAILVGDDPVFGRDIFGPGEHARDVAAGDVPYPCPSIEPHFCGQTLARIWWDIRTGLTDALQDPQAGLESARDLFTAWALITGGVPPTSLESATPQTVLEILVVADDDGDLTTGTPNDCVLCPAFLGRGLSCPVPGGGELDCLDACPTDPTKTSPGVCGCGVADTDTDIDGTPDCIDDCPADPNKVTGGMCGCGVSDVDSDGDAAPDCIDDCPADPNKTGPEICGCGVPDPDSDFGGMTDCNNNGLDDRCDIRSGYSRDCNADDIPDNCATECAADCECHDHDACTYERCVNGACASQPRAYGDVDHSGFVALNDLFRILAAFRGDFTRVTFSDADIYPCTGDNVISLSDLVAVLNAFNGVDPCCGG